MDMRDTLERLCRAYGPTGRESDTADVIEAMVAPYVDRVRRDAMGNLIAERRGGGKGRVMLSAHMDEIGLMVIHIESSGFLRVCAVGGVNPIRSAYRQVAFGNGVRGVVGVETKTLRDTVKDPSKLTFNEMFVDIGAASYEEAAHMVEIGDVAVFMSDFMVMGRRVSAAAMDNRAGCAVQVEALKALGESPMDLYAVFSAQEEVGLRGARTSAFGIEPTVAVAIDVTPAGDTPGSVLSTVDLGRGPAVKIRDSSVLCNPSVVAWLEDAARRAGVAWQREVLTAGGTDAGAIQSSRGGVPSGVVSIPTRYVHSPAETVDISDMEGAAALIVRALETGYAQ
ncbi:MAG: M42 family metallopeptidase [Christensenellales bacterium]|jgi:putative aminopeptidase FrvX